MVAPPEWELDSMLNELIVRVNNAIDGGVSHKVIMTQLARLQYGADKILTDYAHEGRRLEPKRLFLATLAKAQSQALHEMNLLEWRKPAK